MAVQLKRDEQLPVDRRPRDAEEDRLLLVGGMKLALRAALWVAIPAGAALPLAIWALSRALVAADKLLKSGGDHWQEVWMPAVLVAFLGGLTGGALAWRILASASIGRSAVWLVATVALVFDLGCGLLTARALFTSGIPSMCWISLGVFIGAGLGGTYLALLWLD